MEEMTSFEKVMTVKAVADMLGVKDMAVLGYIHKGQLKATKPGKEWLITASAFNAFVNGTGKRVGARVIVCANQKGGVGKTTTCIELAAALGAAGKRVLFVDFDPQASGSLGLGVNTAGLTKTIYQAVTGTIPLEDAIQDTPHGFKFVPSTIDLVGVEVELAGKPAREIYLRRTLAPVLPDFDYVLIDTHPSLGLLELNALTAAHDVLIPVACDVLSLGGLPLLFETIQDIRKTTNPDLSVLGILATRYDSRLNISKAVYNEIAAVAKRASVPMLSMTVKENVRIKEAPGRHEPAVLSAVNTEAAQAYIALAQEIIHADQKK